jgi:hypothetical protein
MTSQTEHVGSTSVPTSRCPHTEPTPSIAPRSNRIASREANRALYIDFEGRKNEPPALLGLLRGTHHRVLILDPTLRPLARYAPPELPVPMCVRPLARAVTEVLALAADTPRPRRIVGFSLHELRMVEEHVGRPSAEHVADRYLNARKFFAAWYHRERPDLAVKVENMSLDQIARALGCAAWPEIAFSPADAIKRLRAQLATRRHRRLEPTQRTVDLWHRLVAYNRHDCLVTQYLVRRVAGGVPVRPWAAPLHD